MSLVVNTSTRVKDDSKSYLSFRKTQPSIGVLSSVGQTSSGSFVRFLFMRTMSSSQIRSPPHHRPYGMSTIYKKSCGVGVPDKWSFSAARSLSDLLRSIL